jgi:hypothetical protein
MVFDAEKPLDDIIKRRRKEARMALVKTWYTPAEAQAKFGLGRARILEWVEEGLVRAERENDEVIRVNIDDIELQVEALSGNQVDEDWENGPV